ncbi:hypothetical protein AB431_13960 [Mycobacterium sp. EPa45]|nr:hypothetical protein AB431_13960 [Mycobacterium sp. EPa45]
MAGIVFAPAFAHAEPDSGTGSSGSAGSARSGTNNRSTDSKSASEAKAWQDLEDKTAKAADALTKAEQQALATRIAQARRQLDQDQQAQDDAITQQKSDVVTGIQDRFGTLQQLSSAQSSLALEMSDAADEAAVLSALQTGDTAAARAQVEQAAKDRQALLDEKRALTSTLADQTQGISAVAGAMGQIISSLGAMESLQKYDADQTEAILDAKAQAQADPEAQAQLTQQLMDVQKEVRDKLMAIQADQSDAMRAIARNI